MVPHLGATRWGPKIINQRLGSCLLVSLVLDVDHIPVIEDGAVASANSVDDVLHCGWAITQGECNIAVIADAGQRASGRKAADWGASSAEGNRDADCAVCHSSVTVC